MASDYGADLASAPTKLLLSEEAIEIKSNDLLNVSVTVVDALGQKFGGA